MFDCVAQRRTRHDRYMLIKEATELVTIDFLASLSKRPAHSLVNQVMAIWQQDLSETVEIGRLSAGQEGLTADYRNPALPQQVRARQSV